MVKNRHRAADSVDALLDEEEERVFQEFERDGDDLKSNVKRSSKKSNGFINSPIKNGHSRRQNGESQSQGYRVREVDLSDVPQHLFKNMVKTSPGEISSLMPDALSSPEELEGWIIQCPKNVNLSSILKGQKISLNGNPSILEGDENMALINKEEVCQYELVAIPKEKEENVFILLPDGERRFQMTSVPLNGCISVRKFISELSSPELELPRKKARKLPKGIKERHPVYGVDFSRTKVKVTELAEKTKNEYEDDASEKVYERLSFSKNKSMPKAPPPPTWLPDWPLEISASPKKTGPDSPKKSKKSKISLPNPFPQVVEIPEPEISKRKSTKKSKSIVDLEESFNMSIEEQSDDLNSQIKKKAIKKTKSVIDLKDLSQATEELPLLPESPRKKSKWSLGPQGFHLTTPVDESQSYEVVTLPKHKKKKKNRKCKEEIQIPEIPLVQEQEEEEPQVVFEASPTKKSKKSKKRKREEESVEEASFSFPSPPPTVEVRPKKKKIKLEAQELPSEKEIKEKLKRMKRSKSRDKDF